MWAFAGVAVVQFPIWVAAVGSWRKQAQSVAAAALSDQRMTRMDTKLDSFIAATTEAVANNKSEHEAILNAHPHAALQSFRFAYRHDLVAAYELVANPSSDTFYDLVWCNAAAEELWGLSLEEAKFQHPDTVQEEDRPRIRSAVTEAARTGSALSMRYDNVNIDTGEVTPVASRMEPYLNMSLDAIGYIGTIWVDE